MIDLSRRSRVPAPLLLASAGRVWVSLAAALSGLALFLGAVTQRPRALFYCEGFGCSAMGVVYLVYAAVLVLAVALLGALVGSRPRGRSAARAAGMALLAMVLCFLALFVRNQMTIRDAMRAEAAACAQYPQLCPPKAPVSAPNH